ncbi:MAG: hypothetical protein HWN81_00230 [Candidatus Lokiarchaeota archaeon]|nr:hypothetical protein [Candidatus Lokiarchaeota archaeon]
MDKHAIQEMVKIVSPELTWMFIQGILVLFIYSFLKDFINNIINYIKLRFSLWGLNTKMMIDGKVGYIKDIKYKEVEFEVSGEDITIYIPIHKFLTMTKVVYHNGHGVKE